MNTLQLFSSFHLRHEGRSFTLEPDKNTEMENRVVRNIQIGSLNAVLGIRLAMDKAMICIHPRHEAHDIAQRVELLREKVAMPIGLEKNNNIVTDKYV